MADCAAPAAPFDRRRNTQRTKLRKGFAKGAVRIGNQQRHAQNLRPHMPFGNDVDAIGSGIERQRQTRIAVFQHDSDGTCGRSPFRPEVQGDAEERPQRQTDRHGHALNRTTQDHALAMQLHQPRATVGTGIGSRKAQWQGEGVEPRGAARPGERKPASSRLTPQSFVSQPDYVARS